MRVDVQSIYTFLACPLKYRFRYVEGLPAPPAPTLESYSEALHQVIYTYFRRRSEGKVTFAVLKRAWGEVWYKKSMSLEEAAWREQSSRRAMEVNGLEMLYEFFVRESQRDYAVLVVDYPFAINFGRHVIEGKFELVKEHEGGVEIVDFKVGKRTPDESEASLDLGLTIQSYAFRSLFNAAENRLLYYVLKNGLELPTKRTRDHHRQLLFLLDRMEAMLEQNLIYPRYSYECSNCVYRRPCARWEV